MKRFYKHKTLKKYISKYALKNTRVRVNYFHFMFFFACKFSQKKMRKFWAFLRRLICKNMKKKYISRYVLKDV